eukprot:Gb_19797 [translate_table: standard]
MKPSLREGREGITAEKHEQRQPWRKKRTSIKQIGRNRRCSLSRAKRTSPREKRRAMRGDLQSPSLVGSALKNRSQKENVGQRRSRRNRPNGRQTPMKIAVGGRQSGRTAGTPFVGDSCTAGRIENHQIVRNTAVET